MIGVPRILRTKQDFENVKAGVISGDITGRHAARALAHWQGLLSRHRYSFDRLLSEGESPDGSEPDYRVMEDLDEETGDTIRRQLKREEDPNARIVTLGYSVSEVEAVISDMEDAINAG
ncbi:hypothetical protein [Fodinicurvata sediminis]|uniref:hypothetical protein n=1 Tax=Fodinicurvata sediminis TaxID=1121832 RepID=UPI0003B3D674|nr:hypothetical protein [Fodinicurvata sediminis]